MAVGRAQVNQRSVPSQHAIHLGPFAAENGTIPGPCPAARSEDRGESSFEPNWRIRRREVRER